MTVQSGFADKIGWLPNALTILRIICAGITAGLIYFALGHSAASPDNGIANVSRALQIATGFFILGALTDWLDGYIARMFKLESVVGQWLDPIADKLLIHLPLWSLTFAMAMSPILLIPVLVLLTRDIVISLLRHFNPVKSVLKVSFLAKLKTALEMIVMSGGLLGLSWGVSPNDISIFVVVWIIGLWLVSALAVFTGFQYILKAFYTKAVSTS